MRFVGVGLARADGECAVPLGGLFFLIDGVGDWSLHVWIMLSRDWFFLGGEETKWDLGQVFFVLFLFKWFFRN